MNRISFLNRGYAFKGLLAVIHIFENITITVFYSPYKIKVVSIFILSVCHLSFIKD